jgi:xanthine dehydrogenase YagR molybdenum-binding subunit
VRLVSPFIGGGFGGKLFVRADAVLAALGARAAAAREGGLAAAADDEQHHAPARDHPAHPHRRHARRQDHRHRARELVGRPARRQAETAVNQTRLLYAGANRLTTTRLAVLDLPEGNAMRAPGEAPGLMALEIAMDEMAEKLGLDPVEFRVLNDTQVDPEKPERPFSQRQLIECLRMGASASAGASATPAGAGARRPLARGHGGGRGFRNNLLTKSAARVRLDASGVVTVETDMTDIGTGSYTIIAQTAAEMMGVPLDKVVVRLGDSAFPVSAGSGGQWGGNNSTSGVYAACMKLREAVAAQAGH